MQKRATIGAAKVTGEWPEVSSRQSKAISRRRAYAIALFCLLTAAGKNPHIAVAYNPCPSGQMRISSSADTVCTHLVNYHPGSDTGRILFESNCSRCHGADGTKGLFGAKNLRKSQLSDSAIIEQIRSGRRIMPPFKKRLRPEEIQQIAIYIKTLRTTPTANNLSQNRTN